MSASGCTISPQQQLLKCVGGVDERAWQCDRPPHADGSPLRPSTTLKQSTCNTFIPIWQLCCDALQRFIFCASLLLHHLTWPPFLAAHHRCPVQHAACPPCRPQRKYSAFKKAQLHQTMTAATPTYITSWLPHALSEQKATSNIKEQQIHAESAPSADCRMAMVADPKRIEVFFSPFTTCT